MAFLFIREFMFPTFVANVESLGALLFGMSQFIESHAVQAISTILGRI